MPKKKLFPHLPLLSTDVPSSSMYFSPICGLYNWTSYILGTLVFVVNEASFASLITDTISSIFLENDKVGVKKTTKDKVLTSKVEKH